MQENQLSAQVFLRMFRQNGAYLYRVAAAAAGDSARAERALCEAMRAHFAEDPEPARKGAYRAAMTRAILRACDWLEDDADAPASNSWRSIDDIPGEAGSLFASLDDTLQRAVTLCDACLVPPRQAARLTGADADALKNALRSLHKAEDAQGFPRALRKRLGAETGVDLSSATRAFETEIADYRKPRHIARKIARCVAVSAFALLLCVLFWLLAVLLEG